jgi:hypothetical protein
MPPQRKLDVAGSTTTYKIVTKAYFVVNLVMFISTSYDKLITKLWVNQNRQVTLGHPVLK